MDEYDVVVVGAGPAGGSCARELSRLGRNVLLLERSEVIGNPNFSTGGTPNETMSVFGLPKKVTDCPWSSLLFASKNARAEFLYKKGMGHVLNYKKLKQFLAKDAKKSGCVVETGAVAKDLVMSDGKVCGVKYTQNGELKTAESDVLVDASGGRCLFSQKLGLVKLPKNGMAIGIEHHMKNVELERRGRLDFYLGGFFVPGGYAWIFPMGKSSAKVGVGTFVYPGFKVDVSGCLKNFVENNSQTKRSVKFDTHGGSLLALGGIKNHVFPGFVAIGDAAVQINPIACEGIRHGLHSGRIASNVIDSAINLRDFGEKSLGLYNKLWKSYIGNKWKMSFVLQQIFYKVTMSDNVSDRLVSSLNSYDPESMFEICFNYNFGLIKSGLSKVVKRYLIGLGV